MDEALVEYRKFLVAAEQKSQEDFDKTVLALSGGALGISLTFLKDVIGQNPVAHPWLIVAAWIAWAFSALAVLWSYHMSHLALRDAIKKVDAGTIRQGTAGGKWAKLTAYLNVAGALLFVAGVIFISTFVAFNFTPKANSSAADQKSPSGPTTQSSIQRVDPPKVPASSTVPPATK